MKDEPRQETNKANLPSYEDKDKKTTPSEISKPENSPQKKRGPGVDIGPGPGADVVATPPNRI